MSTPDEAELCYPHLGNSSCRRIMRSHSVSVLISIILSSISVLTVTLNLLVIISISHFKKLHTPTNFLLLSLALSDFSVGFVWISQILLLDGCWYFSDGWCVFNAFLTAFVTCASVGTVVLISVDRYVAVCDPMHYSTKVTPNTAKMSVVLCWFCFFVFYTAMLKDNIEHPGGFNTCVGECVVYLPPVAGIIHIIFTFIFPVSIIVVLYVRVFAVAVSQARAMRSHVTVVTLHGSLKVNRSELKAARTLGVVVVVFIMCLSPLYIATLSAGFAGLKASSYVAFSCVHLINSLLNPVIYAFLYPWFRKCVKCIFSLQILKSGSSEANIL
ncbi:trace amine-associated receptor 13c-like [Gouania willdenowi]|uniref:trace amine-associated receptor 13c-like n=1 Tax=Gouania willdenowi TaxID=441366 RepID=UPI001054261F|nr:trace amine-associated receptor 13c-like [Gouania willdenowi]